MQKLAGLMLVGLSAAAIGLGLWQVGGPEQARAERRDEMRLADLRAHMAYRRCMTEGEAPCGEPPPLLDAFTGAPYRLEVSRVCADFERPDRLPEYTRDALSDGCLTLR